MTQSAFPDFEVSHIPSHLISAKGFDENNAGKIDARKRGYRIVYVSVHSRASFRASTA